MISRMDLRLSKIEYRLRLNSPADENQILRLGLGNETRDYRISTPYDNGEMKYWIRKNRLSAFDYPQSTVDSQIDYRPGIESENCSNCQI